MANLGGGSLRGEGLYVNLEEKGGWPSGGFMNSEIIINLR